MRPLFPPPRMPADYVVERSRWSGADLEQMSWHDAPVHGIAYLSESHEIAFDLDYLLKWVRPAAGEVHFTFWIAPATLTFENVRDLRLDLDSFGGLTILNVTREDEKPTREGFEGPAADWRWTLDCLEGVIQFRATGFRQKLRRPPVHSRTQRLPLSERGGISFNEARDAGEPDPSCG